MLVAIAGSYCLGDLTISVSVLYNYLEANSKVPWEDLRYLFGEIMYGGHITDDWDRRLCISYLEEFMQPDLVRYCFKLLWIVYEGSGKIIVKVAIRANGQLKKEIVILKKCNKEMLVIENF